MLSGLKDQILAPHPNTTSMSWLIKLCKHNKCTLQQKQFHNETEQSTKCSKIVGQLKPTMASHGSVSATHLPLSCTSGNTTISGWWMVDVDKCVWHTIQTTNLWQFRILWYSVARTAGYRPRNGSWLLLPVGIRPRATCRSGTQHFFQLKHVNQELNVQEQIQDYHFEQVDGHKLESEILNEDDTTHRD